MVTEGTIDESQQIPAAHSEIAGVDFEIQH